MYVLYIRIGLALPLVSPYCPEALNDDRFEWARNMFPISQINQKYFWILAGFLVGNWMQIFARNRIERRFCIGDLLY